MIKSKYSSALKAKKPKVKTTKKITKKKEVKAEVKKLTLKQELFCQLYATNLDYYGNWVQAYIEAYKIDLTKKWAYKTAQVSASQNLWKHMILERLRELGDEVLNDAMIDKELAFVASQRSELWPKMKAINEYNKLKNRITDKLEIKHSWDLVYWNMSNEELEKKKKQLQEQKDNNL